MGVGVEAGVRVRLETLPTNSSMIVVDRLMPWYCHFHSERLLLMATAGFCGKCLSFGLHGVWFYAAHLS